MDDQFRITLNTGDRWEVRVAQGLRPDPDQQVPEVLPNDPENQEPFPEDTDPAPQEDPSQEETPEEEPGKNDAFREEEETTEETLWQDSGEDAEEDAKEDTEETTLEGCDHGWYPELAIGLGVLSLLLTLAVVLLAIRLGKRGSKGSKGRKGGKAKKAAKAPQLQGPSSITVGKLHNVGARESQQDSLAVTPEGLYGTRGVLAVVADGMGGLADGDKMSQAAATAMITGFMGAREGSVDLLLPLTESANAAVNQLLGHQKGRSGTTLVAGILKDGFFNYVSVGDSRICLYRGGILTQLNREHVYRNELMVQAINSSGTFWDAGTHPKAAGLTSYLGMGSLKYVDIPAEYVRLLAGDKIILMSDGVYNALTLPEMESAMALPAQQAADHMGQLILSKGYRNQDNFTAVILECGGEAK